MKANLCFQDGKLTKQMYPSHSSNLCNMIENFKGRINHNGVRQQAEVTIRYKWLDGENRAE